MNGIQRRKVGNDEKPFPGCLGRMVNLFDLSTGISRNKLLTDAPHREGPTLSRNQADVARMFNHSTNQSEDNLSQTVPELQRASNKRASGTPVKMLIDQEMSEMESTHNPPNVVAKLMGLETLPHQFSGSSVQRNNVRTCPKSRIENHGVLLGCREHSDFLEEGMKYQVDECSEQKEYKDVYEIWQRSPQTNYIKEKLPKGMESEVVNDRKMALVRQKFVEAKRLATDEKLRQSKEFQEALEVLSSNKDLFVKFLQEPNSLFTQHLNEFQSIPPSPETKRITVLRPSKVSRNEKFTDLEKKTYRQSRLPAQRGQSATLDKSDSRLSPTPATNRTNEYAVGVQPTRIVVLKPSPGRNLDNKPIASSPGPFPRVVQDGSFNEGFEDDDVKESRKFARNITQKMCDNLLGHRRDETLISSVFSNGYTGDESSFEKSENDYAVENLSDLEVISSSSRHSWEYVNRYSSPYSSSSFSRISCSPESSVCREAKKRLSERWAMMTTHGNYQERRQVRRNSSTLGEMLALSDAKKSTVTDNEVNEHEQSDLDPCLNSDENIECLDDSPTTLKMSKSVSGSSALFGVLNLEASDLDIVKTDDPKWLGKPKGVKSSFNEKVSSLFFSRNKKTVKEKYSGSQTKDEPQSCSAETLSSSAFIHHSRGLSNAAFHSNDGEGCSSGTSFLHLTNVVGRGGAVHHEAGLSVKRPFVAGNVGENQEQPSPISVLEPPFSEDDNTHLELSSYLKPRNQEFCMPFKNSLIDKSPPIESIARSIFRDGSYSGSSAPCALKSPPVSTCLKEEQNWHCLVQALLTMSGLSNEIQQCSLLFTKWHSLANPLDPSLRNKYANLSSKEPMLEAERRQLRSSRKLVFDCVNAALINITSQELDHRQTKILAHDTSLTLLDYVMVKLKDWICGESRCLTGDIGDSNSLVVERVVRKEVGGKNWDEHLLMEMDNLGKEVERRLLEELLEEAVVELTGKV
ncbi:DUF3741 domain-containing protein/DUF4378 domain-containing protein [Cucumis melo var. makuwa]|nr:DUF3741 domain-containing protein/DUF4378 domain-containing protein [Cucumis melo var. makuwa]TYJ98030.1 DUF3741 domain-containing protein/DUF4378 domain-containing protein [Cucumis melo var. makuwa]